MFFCTRVWSVMIRSCGSIRSGRSGIGAGFGNVSGAGAVRGDLVWLDCMGGEWGRSADFDRSPRECWMQAFVNDAASALSGAW